MCRIICVAQWVTTFCVWLLHVCVWLFQHSYLLPWLSCKLFMIMKWSVQTLQPRKLWNKWKQGHIWFETSQAINSVKLGLIPVVLETICLHNEGLIWYITWLVIVMFIPKLTQKNDFNCGCNIEGGGSQTVNSSWPVICIPVKNTWG